jgi:hypothetical protein
MTRRAPLRDAVSVVWALLVAATCISWAVGADHGNGHAARQLATAIVLLVAFIKVRMVGMYFMELRYAPAVLRTLFDAWCLLVGGGVLAMYLIA